MDQGKVIDIKIDPSTRDLRIFAALWLVFFVVLGKLAFFTDKAIFSMACFTSVMFLVSLALNRDYPRRDQLRGAIIPGVLWSIFAGEHLARGGGAWWTAVRAWQPWPDAPRLLTLSGDGAQWTVLAVVLAVAVAGGILIFASRDAGRFIYRTWMFAALPIGWTFSHVILAAIYYGVITPIGLALRLTGHDAMRRRFDPNASSYWLPRRVPADPARYFRQF